MGRTPNKPRKDDSGAGTAPSEWRPDTGARRAKKKANALEELAARLRRSVVSKDGGIATLSNRELLSLFEQLIDVEKSYLEASKDPRAITVRKPALQIVFNYHPEGYDPLNPPAEQQPTAPASTPTNEKKTAPAEPAKPGAKPPRPAAKVNTFISSRTGQRVPYETDEEGEDLI